MSLIELVVEDFRCLQRVELELHPRHNLIYGDNGSGKTSLLEAIFLLGRGRSFRTRNSERLIRHGQQRLIVFGRTNDVPSYSMGVQVARGQATVARISGTPARSLTELARAFPVQVIEPGVHKLVEESGHRRRRWMDWTVFHVEHHFGDWWVRYTRTLKQRNAALRQQSSQASAWDPELARLGELIAAARREVIERLQGAWKQTVLALSGLDVELHYTQGWAQDVPLAQALTDARARDQSRGTTHVGPHRADVQVRLGGRPAREVLSRGQQKLVAVAMTLAPFRLLRETAVTVPTLLLDDPAAELDGSHLARFIAEIQQLNCQLILTSLQPDSDPFGRPERVFHVEQGRVRAV
jgi:DNA replication and repair protein RecF